MSFASKFNTANTSTLFTRQTPNDLPYAKGSEVAAAEGLDKVHTIHSIYINPKGHYGESVVIVSDKFQLNAPKYLLDTAKQILADSDAVKSINDGQVGFKLYEYQNNKGKQFGVQFVDIDSSDIPF